MFFFGCGMLAPLTPSVGRWFRYDGSPEHVPTAGRGCVGCGHAAGRQQSGSAAVAAADAAGAAPWRDLRLREPQLVHVGPLRHAAVASSVARLVTGSAPPTPPEGRRVLGGHAEAGPALASAGRHGRVLPNGVTPPARQAAALAQPQRTAVGRPGSRPARLQHSRRRLAVR